MTTKLLYDADGAAELLSTTPLRISELRRAGKLAAVLDGKKYKFTADELQRYAASLPAYEPFT
jgi:excisionase family DNA binding protein